MPLELEAAYAGAETVREAERCLDPLFSEVAEAASTSTLMSGAGAEMVRSEHHHARSDHGAAAESGGRASSARWRRKQASVACHLGYITAGALAVTRDEEAKNHGQELLTDPAARRSHAGWSEAAMR